MVQAESKDGKAFLMPEKCMSVCKSMCT